MTMRTAFSLLSRKVQLFKPTLLAVMISTALPVYAVQFQATLLPLEQGQHRSDAVAINAQGQIVGTSAGDSGAIRSWYWSASTGLQQIGNTRQSHSIVRAINDAGTVVGTGSVPGGTESFSWTPTGGMVLLGSDGRALSDALGINNAGVIVGKWQSSANSNVQAAMAYPGDSRTFPLGSVSAGYGATATGVNDAGTVVGTGGSALGQRAFAWTPSTGLSVLSVPIGTRLSEAAGVNRRNEVVGNITGADGVSRAAVWQAGGGAPTLLPTIGTYSSGLGINDVGQVVGFGYGDGPPVRSFLWSRSSGTVDINSLLVAGSSVDIAVANAINAEGLIVGRTGSNRAVLLTPTGSLIWQGLAGGSFNNGGLWEHGFAPSRLLDAVVAGPATQTVYVGADATVKSLTVGSANGGRPTLALQSGALLTSLSGSVLVEASGTLAGDGRIQGGVVNRGTVRADHLRIEGGLSNAGLVTGTGRIDAGLSNSGVLKLNAGQALVLSSTADHVNTGRVDLRGGELEVNGSFTQATGGRLTLDGGTLRANDGVVNRGSIEVGFTGGTISGSVTTSAGGRIVISGNGRATFTDAVEIQAGGELRVATGSQALFFGTVRQRSGAIFSGNGTKFYEGGLAIGNSPGTGIDEGSIALGSANFYEAEIGADAFDRLLVRCNLHFGGTLKLIAWDGFAAQAGQRFDLFDWGSVSGQFDSIDVTALGLEPGLSLDTSQLYTDGSISISAVPEAQSWILLLAGLAVLGVFHCRRRTA